MAAVLDRGDGRGGRPLGPERHQFQDGFTLGVHAERAADGGVDEARVETRRQPERTAHRQEVREQGPGVPEEVAVATRLILPRVPPVDRGEKNRRRAPGDRLVGDRVGEECPHVARAEASQREVARAEVVEPGLEPVDPAHGDIGLGLVERARRRGGAKEDLTAPGVRLLLGHPCRVVEERGEVGQGHARGGPLGSGREGGEGVDRERVDLARQRERREIRVDLEGKRLDVPGESVAARADRRGRVCRPIVVLAGDARLAVRHLHGLTSPNVGRGGPDGHAKSYGGRKTPRSVMIAVMSAAGVTSNAGLNTDRKSTRLNSSHGYISYAVFCLKKKKRLTTSTSPPTPTSHLATPRSAAGA